MTLVEHLAELRRRIIVSAIVVVTCTVIVFFFYNPILHFLSAPYEHVTKGQTGCGGTVATATHRRPAASSSRPARSSRSSCG